MMHPRCELLLAPLGFCLQRHNRAWELANAGLDRWLPLAHRLSMSLGVGPLRSRDVAEQKTLQDMFLRFMKVRGEQESNNRHRSERSYVRRYVQAGSGKESVDPE